MVVCEVGVTIPIRLAASAKNPEELILSAATGVSSTLVLYEPDSAPIGCRYHSAAGEAGEKPSHAAPATAEAASTRAGDDELGDDDDIAALQLHVLLQIAARGYLAVVELQNPLSASGAAYHDDAIQLCVGVAAARQGQCLQNVDRGVHHERAGFVDLPYHVCDVSLDVGDGDGQ